jgi:hypothetical protein
MMVKIKSIPIIASLYYQEKINTEKVQLRLKSHETKIIVSMSILEFISYFCEKKIGKSITYNKIAELIKKDPSFTLLINKRIYNINENKDKRNTLIIDIITTKISEDYNEYYNIEIVLFDHSEPFWAFDLFEKNNPLKNYKPKFIKDNEVFIEAYKLFDFWLNYIITATVWIKVSLNEYTNTDLSIEIDEKLKIIKSNLLIMSSPDLNKDSISFFETKKDRRGLSIMDILIDNNIYGSGFDQREEEMLFHFGDKDKILDLELINRILFQLALKYIRNQKKYDWSPKYYLINGKEYDYQPYYSIGKEALNLLLTLLLSKELFQCSNMKASSDAIWPIECGRDGGSTYQRQILENISNTLHYEIMVRINEMIKMDKLHIESTYFSHFKQYIK